jgi:hypothetical protein
MTKYIKDKSGKFAGSLPEVPKLDSPSIPAPVAPVAPVAEVKPAFGTPEWHAWVEEKRLVREEQYARRAEARTVIENFTDKIHSEYPDARFFVFDDEWNPLRVEGYDNKVILDLESEEHGALADTLKIETMNAVEGFEQYKAEGYSEYKGAEGNVGISMLIKCPEADDCNFRRPAFGFAPSHKASERCMSGKRPHCTCDTCF